ncbi:uncharacterized protein LOC111025023 [Momordica charantia]|uniref:Uncharacterized protein LOC111025023 n=1 Tax=Momordica charantia TaxID=3673 RepID=A0A6J1DW76_MOMCH|nr:uncharacterized protein LOC111025023 [Momordica charantia]
MFEPTVAAIGIFRRPPCDTHGSPSSNGAAAWLRVFLVSSGDLDGGFPSPPCFIHDGDLTKAAQTVFAVACLRRIARFNFISGVLRQRYRTSTFQQGYDGEIRAEPTLVAAEQPYLRLSLALISVTSNAIPPTTLNILD